MFGEALLADRFGFLPGGVPESPADAHRRAICAPVALAAKEQALPHADQTARGQDR
jgi:hypothetical protein